MKNRIDLNKMSEQGRSLYLQGLLEDLSDCIHDLTSDRVRYDYTTWLLEAAQQASKDLITLRDSIK